MEQWIIDLFNNLISACIGDIDPYKYMSDIIQSQDMPEELHQQKKVMEAIEFCHRNNLKPIEPTILSWLTSEGCIDPTSLIQPFLIPQHNPGEVIKSTSAILFKALKNYHADEAWQEAHEIWNKAGSYSDKVEAIESVLSSIKTDEEQIYRFSQEELYDKFIEEMRNLYENRQKFDEVGPTLPYEASDAFFSRFKPKEISAFMAYTGWGKTMFCMDIAEYIAWIQDYPCDVVVLLLETDPINIQKRQFAKRAKIPYKLLDSGEIDIDDITWLKRFNKFQSEYIMRNETGKIHYVWIPQPTIGAVLRAMDIYSKYIENSSGRDIMFMVDYLQKIQPIHLHEKQRQHQFYENCTEQIASKTRFLSAGELGVHTIIFAQENPDTGEVFGSKTLRQKSQLLFSLKRFELEGTDDKDVPITSGGIPLKDSLGNDRFWHREGDLLSSRAELHVVKGNDTAGFVINLKVEAAMGIIHQEKSQLKKLRNSGQLVSKRKKSNI